MKFKNFMEYDFVVGSIECKLKLMRVFPDASIICSPYVESPTTVYSIKTRTKFDVMDLITDRESELLHFESWENIGHMHRIVCDVCGKEIPTVKLLNVNDIKSEKRRNKE